MDDRNNEFPDGFDTTPPLGIGSPVSLANGETGTLAMVLSGNIACVKLDPEHVARIVDRHKFMEPSGTPQPLSSPEGYTFTPITNVAARPL